MRFNSSSSFFSRSYLLCLLFLQTFALYIPANAQENLVYYIQLGVLKNTSGAYAADFKSIGTMYTEDAGQGLTRVLLGKFNTRADAEKGLLVAAQKGFPQSFIVARAALEDKASSSATTTPAKTPNTLPEKVFLAQIGAYSQGIPPADLAKAVLHGTVYSEKVGTLLKVYVGIFNTSELATQAVTALKVTGLTQSFKREMPSATLSQLTLVKEGRLPSAGGTITLPPARPPSTPVTFTDKTTFVEDISMFNNGSKNDTVAIDGRILPISPKECLFIGTLDPYNSDAYQPLVLRTDDGGKSWYEAMPSEYGNSINSIQFVDKKTVFLTTMWVIEGPGEVNLFRSDDAGKTWRKVSKIPRNDFLCVSSYLHFSDANKGKIIYTCSDNEYWVWETTDGGIKWKSKGKITSKDFQKLKNSSLLDYSPKPSYTAVNDPTAIFKQISTPDVHIIQLRNPKTKKFAEISRLVKWYQLTKDNQVVPK